MTKTKIRVRIAIYTRISLDRTGEGLGVARQLADALALADRIGGEVVAEFDDNDISAFSGKTRPGFEALLEAMRRGDIDVVICWHVDRLYRSMKDLLRLIEVAEANGVQIKAVQGGELDLSTSAGRMVAKILGSVAEQESEHKGERQVRAARQRAERGKAWWPTRAFGYTLKDPSLLIRPDGTQKDWANGELVEAPREAAALRDAYAAVRAGRSLMGIAAEWNAKGIKTPKGGTWKGTTLRMTLLNARYAGIRVYNGEKVGTGDWPAIVDEDTYDAAKVILTDPSRVHRPNNGYKRRWLLTRIAVCGQCGKHIGSTVNWKRPSYQCRHCLKVSRQIQPTDNWVIGHVVDRLSRDDAVELTMNRQRSDLPDLRAQEEELLQRLQELQPMLSNPKIPTAMVEASFADIDDKLAKVRGEMADGNDSHIFADLVPVSGGERDAFFALPPDQRRGVQRAKFDALPLDRRRAVVDRLVSVTIHTGQPSRRAFMEDLVSVVEKP